MSPADLFEALKSALQHFNRAEYAPAETLCRQVLTADAENADALHLLGLIAHGQGRPDAAVDLIQRALAAAPGRPDLHRNLGIVLKSLGRTEDALASYQRAAQLAPAGANESRDLRAALDHAARVAAERLREGGLRDAQALCRRVLDIEPDHPDALHLLGLVHAETGDSDRAFALIGRAIELSPAVPHFHANRGLLYERAGRHAEAMRHYEAVSRLTPDSHDAWRQLAASYKRAGRQYDAIVAWERAWARHPDDGRTYLALWGAYQEIHDGHLPDRPPADPHVGAIARGNTARARGKPGAAEALYREALALRPEAPFAVTQLGCLLAAERRYAEADACFRLLAQKYPYPNEVIRFDPGFIDALADGRGDPRYPQLLGAPGTGRQPVVVLIAGGTEYFRTYAWALVASILRNGGLDCLVHVHVVNPDEFIAGEIEFMRRELGCPDLAYTFERVEFPAGSAQERPDGTYSVRTHLSCSRFLQLPRLLEHYARPVLMLDLDLLVVKDLRPALAAATASDIGVIRLGSNTQRIWDLIYATVIYAQPTPRARAFLGRVADYVWHHLAQGKLHWGLEQIAWYAVTAAVEERPDAPRFHHFPRRIVQGTSFFGDQPAAPEYAEDACIWTITASMAQNKGKLDLPEYRRHLPRIKRVHGWYLPGTDRAIGEALAGAPARDGRRLWKADVERLCLARLPRRRRALDIGAHAGLWSWMLCGSFEQVDAYEPDPVLLECWRRNVVKPNTVLHAQALANEPALTAPADGPAFGAARLDDLGLNRVDFVRLGAEGDEELVLHGGQETLLREKPLVLLDPGFSNPRYRMGDSAAVRYLEGLGARVIDPLGGAGCLMGWQDS